MASLTLKEIAAKLGAELIGDGSVQISGVAGIRYAGPSEIAFISEPRYAADAATTSAGALIVGRNWTFPAKCPLVKADKPEAAFASVVEWFAPPAVQYQAGVHPTAVIAADAQIGSGVHIGPYCIVGAKAKIGNRTVLAGHNVVGESATVGEDGLLHPLASLREHVRIGNRVIIHNGAVIGSDGFGYHADAKGVRTKIPQVGIVEIGDDVEIGANSTIDRARFGRTIIGNGVKIDNLVMVAHNVTIGDHAVLCGQVGIAGSSSIGEHAILAGQVGVVGHVQIGPGVVVMSKSAVTKDTPSKTVVSGIPAVSNKEFLEAQAGLYRLSKLKERIKEIELRIQTLEDKKS